MIHCLSDVMENTYVELLRGAIGSFASGASRSWMVTVGTMRAQHRPRVGTIRRDRGGSHKPTTARRTGAPCPQAYLVIKGEVRAAVSGGSGPSRRG